MTPQLLDALAEALGIGWPNWYREFVLALLKQPCNFIHGWLPGGFVYGYPQLAYRDTLDYRGGQKQLFRRTSPEQTECIPWPPEFVVVGGCGDGNIVIDTKLAEEVFFVVDKEDCTLKPFISMANTNMSLRKFAEFLYESERKAGEKRLKERTHPNFR